MSKSKAALQKAKPWSQDSIWWVLLVEGIIAAGLGLYILAAPESASVWLVYLLATLLLVDGLLTGFRGIRRKRQRRLNFLRSGVALVGGLLALLPLFGVLDIPTSIRIVSLAFVTLGVLRIVGFFVERRDHVRFGEVVFASGLLSIGGWLLYQIFAGSLSAQALMPLGWLLLVFGAFLSGYAFFMRSHNAADDAPKAVAQPKPAKSPAPAAPVAPASSAATDKPAPTPAPTPAPLAENAKTEDTTPPASTEA